MTKCFEKVPIRDRDGFVEFKKESLGAKVFEAEGPRDIL